MALESERKNEMKNTIIDLKIILPDCSPEEAISVLKEQYGERIYIKDAMFTRSIKFADPKENKEND